MLRHSRCSPTLDRSKVLSEELWMERLHTGYNELAHARYMRPVCRSIGKVITSGVIHVCIVDETTGNKEGYVVMVSCRILSGFDPTLAYQYGRCHTFTGNMQRHTKPWRNVREKRKNLRVQTYPRQSRPTRTRNLCNGTCRNSRQKTSMCRIIKSGNDAAPINCTFVAALINIIIML